MLLFVVLDKTDVVVEFGGKFQRGLEVLFVVRIAANLDGAIVDVAPGVGSRNATTQDVWPWREDVGEHHGTARAALWNPACRRDGYRWLVEYSADALSLPTHRE